MAPRFALPTALLLAALLVLTGCGSSGSDGSSGGGTDAPPSSEPPAPEPEPEPEPEEPSCDVTFGSTYEAYRQETGLVLPRLVRKQGNDAR